LFSRGKYILFADADGATDVTGLESAMREVREAEKEGMSCAIGCRNQEEA